MTYYYQNQCDNACYSPCNYGTVYSYRSYDCGSPCGYRSYDCGSPCGYRSYGGLAGYRGLYSSGNCYGYGSRFCYPYSSRYVRRYSFGGCYPC
uniref:Uncharacterized protein n=1 Tax=Apteryx owenii TaxID=8824 RepID=A0A8B9QMI1_APTOW